MRTTLVGILKCETTIYIFNVGDFCTHGLYADDFLALTEGHPYIANMLKHGGLNEEEVAVYPNRNMLTNVLDIWDFVRIDISKIKNDYKTLLIYSDGLHGYVSEATTREILESKRSVEDKVHILIDKTPPAGGYGNVNVIIVEQAGDLHK